jgi:hypothetical protein
MSLRLEVAVYILPVIYVAAGVDQYFHRTDWLPFWVLPLLSLIWVYRAVIAARGKRTQMPWSRDH